MRRYLLDSNALNAFVDHRFPLTDRIREARMRGDRIGTCEPVVAEMFYGLEFSASKAENMVRLKRGLSQIRTWAFDRSAAMEYGRLAAELKRRGRNMQTVDMMIAAVAFSLGNTVVVSTDSDLSDIPGLAVENWAAVATDEPA
jgi:tRNA(fMet)-specific endonuclease VapC